MTDWKQLVVDFYKVDHPNDPESLVIGPPASGAALDGLEKKLGLKLPTELREFYTVHNGFGIKEDEDGSVNWFFYPVAEIPELVTETRDWFEETHPDIAARFLPFVDWGTGDASGYVFSESGEVLEGIYIFEHEEYEFEADQDWNEFLAVVDSSIRDFLDE